MKFLEFKIEINDKYQSQLKDSKPITQPNLGKATDRESLVLEYDDRSSTSSQSLLL
ncbi:hypothetical protein [Nostoc sp.]|uniref:hypothetical protein n=1 Tax=Nostoc sp. TaxID=1180 RepID=UPI002FFA44B1